MFTEVRGHAVAVPELPEVETVRRSLEEWLPGKAVNTAESHPSERFSAAIEAVGATIETVGRRGKYLLVGLDDDRELVIHLGMTGQLRPAGTATASDPYVRARWGFVDGDALELRDVRRFGRVMVVPRGQYTGTLARLGPEPFDEAFTPQSLHTAVAASRRPIKTQLLSQVPVAGVGNIYADEALWLAGIHPGRRTLGPGRAERLHRALRDVLRAGIAHGGTTLRDYRTPDGGRGTHQNHLSAYGRAGLPCERCARPLRRTVIDGRTTTFCPACQR